MKIFDKLKQLRTEKGVSVEEMCDILGLATKAAYYKKENGTVKFTLSDAKKISDFFHRPIEEIFFTHQVSKWETL